MNFAFRTAKLSFRISALVLFLLVLGLSVNGFAQGTRGGIEGFIKDASGAAVPDAKVVVINQGTGVTERTVVAGKDGHFAVTLLPVGKYRLVVTAPANLNFSKADAPDVDVRVSETTNVAIALKAGAISEEVTVTDVASQVKTTDAATGEVVGSHSVAELPLVTRNFFGLATLSAGTNGEMFDSAALGRGAVTINVNGQRPSNNNYELEGIQANDFNLPILDNVALPNPESVEEFKTQTSLYDASQGRNGGANIQVNLKSGTNKWHGNAYDFYRSDKFNSNDWFVKRSQLSNDEVNKNPRLHQQQYGGSLGGPVPLVKDWFVFGNYQGTRASSATSSGTTFSLNMVALPATRDVASLTSAFFPGGIDAWAPGATMDPVVLNLLNLPASKCPGWNDGTHCIPSVGTVGMTMKDVDGNVIPVAPNTTVRPTVRQGNVTAFLAGKYDENQFTITSDKSIGNNDKVTARYFYDNFSTLQPFTGGSTLPFGRQQPQENRFAKVGWTHSFSGKLVNDFRFGFNRFKWSYVPDEPISMADIGQTRPNAAQFPGIAQFSVSGQFSVGIGANDDRKTVSNGFVYGDDISFTKGKHVFRMGVEVDQYQLNRNNNFTTRGSMTFGNTTADQSVGGSGILLNSTQNFLLGRITTTQAGGGITGYYFRAMDYATYFQDDWKIAPRLTLNLGLRWEFLSTAHDKRGFQTNWNFNVANNPPAQEIHPEMYPGPLATPGVSPCTQDDCLFKKAIEPRVGFAWDIFGNQKTVLRGGFGVYFARTSNQPNLQTTGGLPFQLATSALPFSVTPANPVPNLIPQSNFPLTFGDVVPTLKGFNATTGKPIFNSASGGPFSAFIFQPIRDLVPPHTFQWNLGIQREFIHNWVLEMAYVGNMGRNLLGPGSAQNFSKYCDELHPCTIPNNIGAGVAVPAGAVTLADGRTILAPHTYKMPDGSIQITGATAANANARVPVEFLGMAENHYFGQINGGFSDYHSLQTSILHRFAEGLYFQGAYTWSKCLDNGSGSTFQDEVNGLIGFGDETHADGLQRGACDFDRTHRLTVSWNYELPLGRWFNIANHGLGKAVNGWAVNGLLTWQSNTPFMVYDGSATLTDVNTNNGANFATWATGASRATAFTSTPDCQVGSVDCYINLAAFAAAGPCVNTQNVIVADDDPTCTGLSHEGNVGRNIFRGPRQSNIDFSLTKTTKITERTALQLRWEVFNLFNHPAFQSPQAGGAQFGNYGLVFTPAADVSILGTANRPRIMQFAAKFTF